MKPILFLSTLFLFTFANGQDINKYKVRPPLISFKQSRFSMGVSLEVGPAINASLPNNLNVVYKDQRKSDSGALYASYGLVFDLYSANSVIGLLSGVDFSRFVFGLQRGDSATDLMDISRIELPLYLKFRTGQVGGKHHMWLLLGGVYNIPNGCIREQFDGRQGTSAFTYLRDSNKDQIKSYFSLAASLGYEFFVLGESKHLRMALYSKVVYPISNELNPDYAQFKSTGNSILRNYPGFEIKEYRISFGIKILFQFGQAVAIMASEMLKKN